MAFSLIEWKALDEFPLIHSLSHVLSDLFKKYMSSYQMPGAKSDTRNMTISSVPVVRKCPFSWGREPMNTHT